MRPLPVLAALVPVLYGAAQIPDQEELSQRALFDLKCQPIVDEGRARIRLLYQRAEESYMDERKACGRDLDCMKRAKDGAAQRGREISMEQARIDRQIKDCAASLKPAAPRPSRRPAPRPKADPLPPQTPPYRTTPDGDWDPTPPGPCQGLIDDARERIRKMHNEANEANRIERTNCSGNLSCLNRAKSNHAERGRRIQAEQARLTREIRDCQAMPRTPSGDWDPSGSLPSGRQRQTPNGDWIPEPCQGLIDFAEGRIRKLRNQNDEAYKLERIYCRGDLDCLNQARENAAQRALALKAEQQRLAGVISECQAANP